ncbi:MAG: hypothetical protein WBV94_05040 [Blastocatellia bacterium]
MTAEVKFWAPDTLVIILTRNRPRTLRRCVNIALESIGIADTLVILDDSDEWYVQENHAVLRNRTPRATPIVHMSTRDLLDMLKQYLPTSALEWTNRMAQRDIAPIRNASLILSKCFEAGHVLLVDDDIVGFDISVTRYWLTRLAQKYSNVVVGAHIGGLDETDVISRITRGIKRACSCANTESQSISVRESFTVMPKADEMQRETEMVSGGYLSFRFTSGVTEPFPPGYNEDWLWCLSLQSKRMASVFRIPQIVIHDPFVIRKPSENDLFFELRGDVALQRELARYKTCKRASMPTARQSGEEWSTQQYDHDAPETWVKELLTQAAEHGRECGAFIANQFRAFGLKLIKRMYIEGRFHLDWNQEFDLWKAQSERNRNSFCEAMNNALTSDLVGSVIQKGKM